MPHSSGGGSHSGGSHGGSFHSSSHSSGSRSYGGSYHSTKISKSYFDGARLYVRYKDGAPKYVYSDSVVSTASDKIGGFFILFTACIFMTIGICIAISAIYSGIPRKLDSTDTKSCVIEDNIDIISDDEEQELIRVGTEFREKTGIPICIITANNSDWNTYYVDLENYAYDLYVNRYSDEKHWVLVYTTDLSNEEFDDWYWEGMQGDYTDSILTYEQTSKFNSALHNYFTVQNLSVGHAFIKAFEELNNSDLMKLHPDKGMLGVGVFLILFSSLFMWTGIYTIRNSAKGSDYILCPTNTNIQNPHDNEANCEYCGGLYYKGTVLNCPHCGANIPASNQSKVDTLKPQLTPWSNIRYTKPSDTEKKYDGVDSNMY